MAVRIVNCECGSTSITLPAWLLCARLLLFEPLPDSLLFRPTCMHDLAFSPLPFSMLLPALLPCTGVPFTCSFAAPLD